jgi:DNA-binding PadR family transcriptional regulator
MLRRRWVKATWRTSDNNRRARYYELTEIGRKQLETQLAEWRHSSGAVERVLRFSLQEG